MARIMKEINFERKLFIKNLFNAHMILNQFDLIHFENYETFNKCITNNLFYVEKKKTVKISIETLEDYKNLMKVFSETNITKNIRFILKITDQALCDSIFENITPNKYSIEIEEDIEIDVAKHWGKGKDWISKNRIVKIIHLNPYNYDKKINKIITIYNTKHIRFFELDFNYAEFEYITIKDIEKLRFWLHHLRDWSTNDEVKLKLEIMKSDFKKPIFVSKDLILYLSDKKQHWIWQWFLGWNIDKNGEDIPMNELNKLRMYMDLHKEAMYHDGFIRNWNLVDFEQNLSITGCINEVPLITSIIVRCLHGSL